MIAEGILGRTDRYRLFEPFGLTWNGGPFGVAAAQLTYWHYQMMDRLKERRAASRCARPRTSLIVTEPRPPLEEAAISSHQVKNTKYTKAAKTYPSTTAKPIHVGSCIAVRTVNRKSSRPMMVTSVVS